MVNWKSAVPVVIALAIALGGSFFLYKWIKIKTSPGTLVEVKKIEAVPVAVAKIDLTRGSRLIPEMIELVPFTKPSLPSGYFSKTSDLKGRIITSSLKTGDAIVEHRLAPVSIESGGIAAILESGKRAVAVGGNKIIGISGFISPGNRVDVLVTIANPATQKELTKIVLENLLVLGTGTLVKENSKGEPSPVDVYTLEVTPEQAEKLTLAAAKGRLQFALRGAGDSEPVFTKGATVPELLRFKYPKKKGAKKTAWVPRKKTVTRVEIVKGLTFSKVKVSK